MSLESQLSVLLSTPPGCRFTVIRQTTRDCFTVMFIELERRWIYGYGEGKTLEIACEAANNDYHESVTKFETAAARREKEIAEERLRLANLEINIDDIVI